MTDYYVGVGGSDAAAGTSWALRWLTIGKALGAAGIASGDTVYVGPGTYRETVSVGMTSAVATTNVVADTDGSHTTGTQGPVIWTAFTTNDTTNPSATVLLNLNGRDFLKFSNFVLVGGSANPGIVSGNTANPTDITFENCYFIGYFHGTNPMLAMTTAASTAANWLLDRCIFLGGNGLLFTLTRNSTADNDVNIQIRNSLVLVFFNGSVGIDISRGGAGGNYGGGVDTINCTVYGVTIGVRTQAAEISTTIPCTVTNSIISGATVLSASVSGQITESYNVLQGATPRTNVSAGTGSVTTAYAPMLSLGADPIWGGIMRAPFTPMPGSPLLNFGAGISPPSVDLLNRDRPSGGAGTNMAAGAFERHDFGTKETGTIDTGGLAIRLTGPGDHQFVLPVESGVSRDVSLKVYYDANHGTGTPPQAQLVANNAVGYAGETVTAAASTGSFLVLTFAQFTPTADGYVTLRLRSRAAAGNGYAIFDTVAVV